MTDATTRTNIAQTMRDTVEQIGKTEEIATPKIDRVFTESTLITHAERRKVSNLTDQIRKDAEYLKPARRQGTARIADLPSFIAWANRFKGDTSVLFADPDMSAPSLTCITDYHAAGAPDPINEIGDPTARHCKHRGIYAFPLSDEFKTWIDISNTALDKDDMGEFIEANAENVMDPTPPIIKLEQNSKNEPWENRLIDTATKIEGRFGQLSQLLAMSRKFQVHETSDLQVTSNRDTGEQSIQFLNEHKDADGKPLRIPNLIIIAIPVFKGGAPFRLVVRFRYRKTGGSLKFIMSIYNPDRAFQVAFDEAVAQATKETELPVFLGTPES